MKKKSMEIVKANKGFMAVLVIQVFFILFLLLKLFGSATNVHYEASDFQLEEGTGASVLEDGSVGIIGNYVPLEIDEMNQSELGEDILTVPIEGLRSAAYEVTVHYESVSNPENPHYGVMDVGGVLRFQEENNDKAMKASRIILDDGHQAATGRLWLRIFAKMDTLVAKVSYNGSGNLAIQSVDIQERTVWRVIRLAGYLLLFLLMDLFYVFFFSRKILHLRKETRYQIFVLTGIIAAATIPLLTDFAYIGHDGLFHYERIWGMADALRNGQFPVRMHTGMLGGAGYAQPLFYGEFFLAIPAFLYNCMVPLYQCYGIYAFLVNVATCLISYYCFKKISKDASIGLLASFFYTLAAYRMNNVYLRNSVGEYTAMTFLPLLILGFWMVYTAKDEEKLRLRDYCSIVIGITGIIQTHIISCEMMAFTIIAFCIFFYKKTLKWNRFVTLTKALILTVLVNLWFLVPFLEALQMDVLVAQTDIINTIQKSGSYLSQIFAVFQFGTGGNRLNTMEGEMPITLGFAFVIVMVVYLLASLYREELELSKKKAYKIAGVAFAGVVITIAATNVNFPWDTAKYIHPLLGYYLCDLQFPWRYLSITTIFVTLLTVMVLVLIKERNRKWFYVLSAILAGTNIMIIGFFYTDMTYNIMQKNVNDISEIGTTHIMGGEYMFMNVNLEEALSCRVTAEDTDIQVEKWQREKGVTSFTCENTSSEEGIVNVPVFAYDHYHAIDNGTGEEYTIQSSADNTIQVRVPGEYKGTIDVVYREPFRWRICEIVSLLTAIGMIVTLFRNKKHTESVENIKKA